MAFYVSIGLLLVSLTACLALQTDKLRVTTTLKDVSDECREEMVKCALPFFSPYSLDRDLASVLQTARSIEPKEHCQRAAETIFCFELLIGRKECADLDQETVKTWNSIIRPFLAYVGSYVCQTAIKKFVIHYRCLLTEDVFDGIGDSIVKAENGSDFVELGDRVIQKECGLPAAELAEPVLESVAELIVALIATEDDESGDDDDDDENIEVDEDDNHVVNADPAPIPDYVVKVSKPRENVHARQLFQLKKLLERK